MDGQVVPPAEVSDSEELSGKDVRFLDMYMAFAIAWAHGGWDGDAGYPLAARVHDVLGCSAQDMRGCA
jgi:hypothetical protein